jgi:hypothetical protein
MSEEEFDWEAEAKRALAYTSTGPRSTARYEAISSRIAGVCVVFCNAFDDYAARARIVGLYRAMEGRLLGFAITADERSCAMLIEDGELIPGDMHLVESGPYDWCDVSTEL